MPKLMGLSPELMAAPAVAAAFDDRATLQAVLDVEAALARAEARAGLLSDAQAAAIAAHARADAFDLGAIAAGALRAGTIAIPVVKALTAAVERADPAAAGFVHHGATSQDVADTGLVLQLRRAVDLLLADGLRLERALARLAHEHAGTPMLGRTLLQPGPPITFGFKVAGWLGGVSRALARLRGAAEDALVLQLGGAVGTLASLGPAAVPVRTELARELGLSCPDMAWHAHRDRLAWLGAALGVLVGSLGKLGRDVALLSQAEVGEVAEPGGEGRGGSSTMPHKRNPVASIVILAAAQRTPGLVAQLLGGLVQEHERSTGAWQAEAAALADLCLSASGALVAAIEIAEGLTVSPEAMAANIERTGGLIFAERLMMALTPALGRAEAHAQAERLAGIAARRGLSLREVAAEDPAVAPLLRADALPGIFDARGYLGIAPTTAAAFTRDKEEGHAVRDT